MTIASQDITAVILAGGQGRRMGGVDKGLQKFANAPLALHALLRISGQVGHVMINANRNLAVYESFGVPIVLDQQPDYAGPLAGMHAALIETHMPYLVTVPCDVPYFPTDLVAKLAEPFAKNPELMLSMASTLGRTQPVFCMMSNLVLPSLEEFLRKGGRKIDIWSAELPHEIVEFPDESAFHNVNTLEELKALERQHHG